MWRFLKRGVLVTVIVLLAAVAYVADKNPGTIKVVYAGSSNPRHEQLRAALTSWNGFGQAATQLDQVLLLPRDLRIFFQDCGQANAFYLADSTAVVICYELLTQLIDSYAPMAASQDALTGAVWQTTFFVFYHELGHALVHI